MKTAIILVGCHQVTNERYQRIVSEFRNSGWKNVVLYKPDWHTTSVDKLVSDFVTQLPRGREPLTLLGFSLGAMIALIAASKISVENLIVCSPSGYFVEYEPLLSKDDRAWAEENLKDFQDFSATNIISKINVARGVIICGQAELKQWSDFREWISDLKKQTNWRYIELPGTGHEIEAATYQAAMKKTIHTIAQSPQDR